MTQIEKKNDWVHQVQYEISMHVRKKEIKYRIETNLKKYTLSLPCSNAIVLAPQQKMITYKIKRIPLRDRLSPR